MSHHHNNHLAYFLIFLDFPRVTVGPSSPLLVEEGGTVRLDCSVDAKPAVSGVRWLHSGRGIGRDNSLVLERVSRNDAGIYTCQADNGLALGQLGQGSLELLVLFGPVIEIDGETKLQEGDSLDLHCNVDSEPQASVVEWFKIGEPSFHRQGSNLRISTVSPGNGGEYMCRASIRMQPSNNRASIDRSSNATITVNVMHPPGPSSITVLEGVAVAGRPTTLQCQPSPRGYPPPVYQWWKGAGNRETLLGMGAEYVIQHATSSSEGEYFCQAHNVRGEGAVGALRLEVAEPPRIMKSLDATAIQRIEDSGFRLNCTATVSCKTDRKLDFA